MRLLQLVWSDGKPTSKWRRHPMDIVRRPLHYLAISVESAKQNVRIKLDAERLLQARPLTRATADEILDHVFVDPSNDNGRLYGL